VRKFQLLGRGSIWEGGGGIFAAGGNAADRGGHAVKIRTPGMERGKNKCIEGKRGEKTTDYLNWSSR